MSLSRSKTARNESGGIAAASDPPKTLDLAAEIKAVNTRLALCENAIALDIRAKLESRKAGTWEGADDNIFAAHTAYVRLTACPPLACLPASLWEGVIEPMVKQTEAAITSRIHKGAPLYNTFLCLLIAGDLDKAFQYLHTASWENHLDGRNPESALAFGDHGFSQGTVIHPIYVDPIASWQQDFQSITGITLDEAGLVELIRWLGRRPSDAIQTLLALHRLRRLGTTKDDRYTQHLRIRCLADLILVFESSLRRWQPATLVGELGARVSALLAANPTAPGAHNALRTKT